MRHSQNAIKNAPDIKKFFKIPPLWALFLGLLFNFFHLSVPNFLQDTLRLIASPTKFLIMFSLGVYFSFGIKRAKIVFLSIFLRSFLGLLFGITLVKLFHITGTLRIFAIIFSAAPVGYNTLVLSSLENLDMEFAAEVVSISLFLGLIYIPLMILFVR